MALTSPRHTGSTLNLRALATTNAHLNSERIRRTLTFWLRPAFTLRVVGRFQRVAGFDRAIALASSALTALVSLVVVSVAIVPHLETSDAARKIISRYGLTGAGAQAVTAMFSPAGGPNTEVSVLGAVLLVLATLSFARGVQRLFEQIWELRPLSVRNTANDLVWILGLLGYVAFSWWIHSLVDQGKVEIASNSLLLPATVIFLAWSGRVLSARRLPWRTLAPFAVIGAALLAISFTVAGAYAPHLFSSYATRYGAIGAVLAMIAVLFALMLVVVATAALGREVSEELAQIQRGERPPDNDIRHEWNAIVDHARVRWRSLRDRIGQLGGHHRRQG
jgi:membrane protein